MSLVSRRFRPADGDLVEARVGDDPRGLGEEADALLHHRCTDVVEMLWRCVTVYSLQ